MPERLKNAPLSSTKCLNMTTNCIFSISFVPKCKPSSSSQSSWWIPRVGAGGLLCLTFLPGSINKQKKTKERNCTVKLKYRRDLWPGRAEGALHVENQWEKKITLWLCTESHRSALVFLQQALNFWTGTAEGWLLCTITGEGRLIYVHTPLRALALFIYFLTAARRSALW